jgi:carbon storage regulator
MLVLSRKPDEGIMIGDDVTITVLAVHDGQVKLGIHAPQAVKIYRTELYEEVRLHNVEATRSQKSAAAGAARLLTRGRSQPKKR